MEGKVISISNIKGGVGKTSTAIELATCLSNLKYKVLLIDLDPQSNATENTNCPIENNIYDLLTDKCTVSEAIKHGTYFDIIPGSQSLTKADIEFSEPTQVYLMDELCEVLKQIYDFIIIDTHPSRSILINMLYIASDYFIAPTLCDKNSLEGIPLLENDLKKYRDAKHIKSNAKLIGILLIRNKKRTNAHTKALEIIQQLANSLEYSIIIDTISESIKMSEIKTMAEPLQIYDKYGSASVDYRRFTKRILEVINNG